MGRPGSGDHCSGRPGRGRLPGHDPQVGRARAPASHRPRGSVQRLPSWRRPSGTRRCGRAQPATKVPTHLRRPGLQVPSAGQIQGSHKRELAGPRDSSRGRQERWRCRVHRALLGPPRTTRARWTQGSIPPLHPCGCHPRGSTCAVSAQASPTDFLARPWRGEAAMRPP